MSNIDQPVRVRRWTDLEPRIIQRCVQLLRGSDELVEIEVHLARPGGTMRLDAFQVDARGPVLQRLEHRLPVVLARSDSPFEGLVILLAKSAIGSRTSTLGVRVGPVHPTDPVEASKWLVRQMQVEVRRTNQAMLRMFQESSSVIHAASEVIDRTGSSEGGVSQSAAPSDLAAFLQSDVAQAALRAMGQQLGEKAGPGPASPPSPSTAASDVPSSSPPSSAWDEAFHTRMDEAWDWESEPNGF